MRSGLLIVYRCRLIGMTTDARLDRRFALMRFMTLDTIRVTVVLLSRVTIDAIAGGFRLGMTLMAREAVRVPGIRPSRDRFLFLLMAIRTVGASYPENVRFVAARAIFMVTRQHIRAGYGHLSLVALRA